MYRSLICLPITQLSSVHPFCSLRSPPAVVSLYGQGTSRAAPTQEMQTGCQATAAKDHCVHMHVCLLLTCLCVPMRVLIIKNKHVSLLVGQAPVPGKQSSARQCRYRFLHLENSSKGLLSHCFSS